MSPADAWTLDPADFPADASPAAQLAFAARWALLAPSSHNSQPWRFSVNGDRIDVHADRSRALPVVDPHDRELYISCGAALYFLRVALRRFGWTTSVELGPDSVEGDLCASLWLVERRPPGDADVRLFDAITRRRTSRAPFAADEPPEALRLELVAAAREEDAWLCLSSGMAKEALAHLIAEADRLQMADPAFRDELAAWLRANDDARADGIPGYARARSHLQSHVDALVVRTFDVGDGQAARDHQLAVGSPLLAVLGTDGDDERDWLRAGQAMARVLLTATAAGLGASFLNQPIEVLSLRGRVSEVLQKSGYPQLVLRLGRPTATTAPTPRRRLDEVLRICD